MPITSDRAQSVDVNRHTWLLVLLLVGHVILISVQVSTRSGIPVLETVTFGAFAELQRGAARLYGGVSRVWDRYVGLRGAERDAARLRRQVEVLQLRLHQERARVRRAAHLESLLGLRRRIVQRTLAAQVIAGDPIQRPQTAIIDRGREDGLQTDMAVIAPQGIVGRVIEPLSVHAAKVQLITERNAGVGAILARTGAGGVVVGAADDPLLRLDYTSALVDVRPGDLVVTSGLDRIYPRGLVVGHVERAEKGSALYREILVRPAVDFSALDTVLVVVEPPPMPAERGR
jgi:rod shape-determining protein MreC